MIITWLGMSCFKIQTNKATIILDPYKGSGKIKTPRIVNGDVVLHSTTETHGNGTKEAFHITGHGEYEARGVFCYGINVGDVTVYLLEIERVRVAFLGRLSGELDNGAAELVEHADVLLTPVGGKTVLDGKTASKLATQIEPRVIIPMCYATKGHPAPFDSNDVFLKEMGKTNGEELPKVKIETKNLPVDSTEIIVLSPQ